MDKIMKALEKSCGNCIFNSCFREDECNGCINNELFEHQGLEHKFQLSRDIKTEFEELIQKAQAGEDSLRKNTPIEACVVYLDEEDTEIMQEEYPGFEYYLTCPSCNNKVGQMDDDTLFALWGKYCSECGQALK